MDFSTGSSISRYEETGGLNQSFSFGLALIYLVIVALSLLFALVLLRTYGNLEVSAALVVVFLILFLSFYRIDLAFDLFFGMVLFFDQFIVVPGHPITETAEYFNNLKQNPFLPPTSIGVMNPIEIQLVLMMFGLFLTLCTRRNTKLQGVPVWGLAFLFMVAMLISLAHGLATGGIFLDSLWEVRALFYFLLVYFLVPQVVQTRKQINTLLWIAIFMMAVKDFQGAARFVALGFRFRGNLCLTNHEDPVFTVDLLILLFGMLLFGVRSKHRTAILVLMPVFLLGFYAGKRRAAYAGFIVCVIVFILMLNRKERAVFFKYFIPCLVFVAIYSAVFWNSRGRLGAPVRMVKSGLIESKKADGSHYLSNLYRIVERYDLAVTVRHSPVVGIGFGKKYLQPIPLVKIDFPLQDWIPHDEIIWLIVKMGAVGFFVFCLFIDGLLFETASLYKKLNDPLLKAICLMIAAAIVNQMVVSYFDLQLTYYRDMVFLGTMCGLIPTIKALSARSDQDNGPPPDSKSMKSAA